MRWGGRSIAPWLALALAACATGGDRELPARLARAVDENHRAEQLFARGDYKGALERFRLALRAAESIEDEDSIAANLLNVSIVQQRLGDRAGAIASVDRILGERNLNFGDRRVAEAAVRRALLAMEAGEHGKAGELADLAHRRCQDRCGVSGKILGLRGYLALASGDGVAAEELGKQAVAAHRDRSDDEELANGLRLVGSATLLRGEPARGIASLEEALAIDKRLALPRSIASDLLALGRAHERLGDSQRARGFFQRALAAAQADGNPGALEQAKAGLQRLGNP